ncbi:MAG TPA: hypothetical protein VFX89_03265 [Gammaproteobacteria bacterium]|nr:hypothetical protein [Gammaproteobacteria bacterium]
MSALALAIGVALSAAAVPRAALAGPEGGQIVAGAGSITQSGASTVITQGTDRLGINWQSFNVGQNESVRFEQPASTSVALNRIFDQNPSQILGALDANGRVFLINPNGMVFGENARLNVGALVASSLDISLNDFLNGKNEFNAQDGKAGLVVNRGLIKAATGGSVTLLGGAVANEGMIVADLGQVTLGAGAHAALDFDGDGLIYFAIDGQALANAQADAAVSNSGTIQANGGQVLLSGRAAQDVVSNVVNNTGVVRATRIENSGGVIQLMGPGGTVVSSGVLDASGQGGSGGTVQVLGDRVGLGGNATVDVSGDTGGGLAQIGGSYQGSDPNVLNAQRTFVGAGASIDASARASGDGGQVVVWSGDVTRFYGTIDARGGAAGGNGGLVEVSGKALGFTGTVDVGAPAGKGGSLLLDPDTLHIVGGPGTTGTDGSLDATGLTNSEISFNEGGVNETVSAEAIEGVSGVVTLQATAAIIIDDLDDNGGDGDITLANDTDIVFETRNDAGNNPTPDGPGGISFADPSNSIVASGTGRIFMTAGTVGTAASSLTNIGNLTTDGRNITLIAANNAQIVGTINAGAGDVSVRVDNNSNVANAVLEVAGSIAGANVSLSGITNDILRGSDTVADAFDITAVNQGTLNGATFAGFSQLQGAGLNDTFTFGAAGRISSIDGGTGSNTLTAANFDNQWAINAADGGSLASDVLADTNFVPIAAFSSIQNVVGNAGVDMFTVSGSTGAISGQIDGGLGMDQVHYETATHAIIARVNDTTNGVTGIENLFGNGNATLVGPNELNNWMIAADNNGTLQFNATTLSFDAFNNITGGTLADTFNVPGAGRILGRIDGGADADVVNYATATGPVVAVIDGTSNGVTNIETLTGNNDANSTLTGANVSNAWTINGANDGTVTGGSVPVAFTDFPNVTGGTDVDVFTLAGGTISGTIRGGVNVSLRDRLVADNLVGGNTWAINGVDAGAVDGVNAFQDIENVTGGNTADTFNVSGTGRISGQIDGGAGANTLSYAGATGPVSVQINATSNGFTNIAQVTGNNTTSTLIGANAVNAWTIDGANDGQVGAVSFFNFNNVTGGNQNDTFDVVTGGSISGQINGGAAGGTDIVTYAAGLGAVQVQISAATNGVENIETVTGNGDAGSRLIGADGDQNFWFITAANGGNVTHNGGQLVNFTGFNNVTGGNMFDTFSVTGNGSIGGLIDGGAGGTNTLSYAGVGALPVVTVQVGAATGGIANISSVTGNSNANSTLIGANGTTNNWTVNNPNAGSVNQGGPTMNFSSFNNITGGDQNDAFTVTGAGSIGGRISGGGGASNTINYSGATGPVTARVNGATNGIVGINAVTGNDTNSTLIGDDVANAWSITGANDGQLNGTLTFTNFNNVTGGNNDDAFTLIGAGAISGTIDGGGQVTNDTVSYAALAGPVTVTLGATSGGIANVERITGNNTNSTLVGANTPNAWTIDGANDGQVGGVAFFDFNNVTGGSADDAFTLIGAGAISGQINGGGQTTSDTVSYAALAGPVTVTIGAAVGGIAGIEQVTGNNNNSTLIGANVANAWTINGVNDGTVGTVAFIDFNNLTGGNNDDTFALTGAGALTGQLDGGGQVLRDTVSYAALAGPVTVTAGASGVTGIERVTGNNTNSTLVGANTPNNWTIDGANSGTVGALEFIAFNNLTGGTNDDAFTFTGAGSISGLIDGGAQLVRDTISYAGLAGPVTATLGATAGGFAGIERLTGNNTNSTLVGANTANAWTIDGANDGQVGGLEFFDFNNVTGGTNDDAFVVTGAGAISGQINGGGGASNTVDYSGAAGPVTARIGAAAGGIAGINAVTGNNTASTLIGDNVANVWTVTGPNSGQVVGTGTVAFTGFNNLAGGTAADAFALNGGTLTGSIDGAGGTDTLTGDNVINTFVATGADIGTATGVGGGFTSVENLTGNAQNDTFTLNGGTLSGAVDGAGGVDTLTGGNVANAFVVNAANAGTATGVAGGFSSIENLAGNALADTFTLNGGTLAGAIDGAGGTDTLTGDNVANAFVVTAANGGAATGVIGGFSNVENLTGNAQNDTFTLNGGTLAGAISGAGGVNTLTGGNVANAFVVTGANAGTATGVTGGFTNIQNLAGNAQNDTFTLSGGTLAGAIDGAGGVNTLTGGNVANSFVVTGANAGTATGVTGGFTNVQNLTGNALADTFTFSGGTLTGAIDGAGGTDTLTGDNVVNAFVVTAANGGTATGAAGGFSNVENLTGNAQNDTFVLNGGTLAGVVDGAGGANSLTGGNVANTFVVTSANAGTATGVTGGFTNVQSLIGNAQNDTFTLNGGTLAGAIDGAGGVNTLTGGNVANTFVVTSANTGTATGVTGGFTNVQNLTGNAQADTFTLNGGTLAGTVDGAGGSDTLTGDNVASTFVVTSANAGTATGTGGFANVENLAGNAQSDTFTLNGGTLTGAINGAGGVNTLTGGNVANTFVVTSANAGTATGVTGGFTNVQSLTGGAQNDTFTLNAALAGAIQGADGNDTIAINAGGSAASIDAGNGTDVLDLSANAAAHAVTLTSVAASGFAGTADAAGFTGIDDVRAGASTADSLTGLNAASTWTIGAAKTYATGGSTLAFAGFENLTGGSAVDTFNLNTAVGGTLNGGAGNDVFTFADGVTAAVVDGGAGTDVLDLSAYTSARNVTLTAAGATDGFNGTEASVTGGFRNIDDVRGSATAADVISGLANAQATWLLAGNTGNQYSSGGRTLAFSSFSTVNGGSGVDSFGLGGAGQTGDLTVSGGGGADAANVASSLSVGAGNLTLTGIETVTASNGAVITAGRLTISGASSGVGVASGPLAVQASGASINLDIDSGTAATNVSVAGNALGRIAAGSVALRTNNGSVGAAGAPMVFSTTSSGLSLNINAGSGDVNASVAAGNDAKLDLVKGNNVTIETLDGDILHDGQVGDVDIQAGTRATVIATKGIVGTEANRLVVDVPATGVIQYSAQPGSTVSLRTVQNTPLLNIGSLSVNTSILNTVANEAVAAGQAAVSAADALVTIDWAGLDPNVALIDCLQPCVKLPADQSEDPALAQIREATKLLLIRTDEGWKMIPVFPREVIASAN